MLNSVAGLPDTGPDDVRLVTQPFLGFAQFAAQMIKVVTTDVPELDPFEVLPDALVGVEIRRIAGQAFQVNTFGSATGQEVFDGLTGFCAVQPQARNQ